MGDEYKSVKLWFENNSKLEDARKEGLKALLYQLFAVPDPNQPDNDDIRLFDFLACLLHCCPDDSHEAGVVKAFKMVAAGDAPLKKEDVARIATAGVGVLDDMGCSDGAGVLREERCRESAAGAYNGRSTWACDDAVAAGVSEEEHLRIAGVVGGY